MVQQRREDVMNGKGTSTLRKLRRIPLFIGAVLVIIFAKPQFPGIWIGMILILLGESIRIWAAGHLQKNEVLTVTGPYAYVKNPLYIGSIFIRQGLYPGG
jgi:protein-S-isoprenylcysteine O-methyltransferase Ste14